MPEDKLTGEKFIKAVGVMRRLREPGGCPWDREQDYMSLRRYIIEEAYELIQAIEAHDTANMCEECGDLLLQIVFVSRIAEELGEFDICDVLDGFSNKMIRRHPHVFGDTSVKDSDEVLVNWEKIKKEERREKDTDSSFMAGIPRGMPALLRAYRIQERAAKPGFDWEKGDSAPVFAKVEEELREVRDAAASDDKGAVAEEVGDLIFAAVNLARHLGVDPEIAAHSACEKFSRRFREVEKSVAESGRSWSDFTLGELDEFWNAAKHKNEEEK
ncbi:MAG: nucleoside triphosphate pyrophosphohydrolase [Synergistes sp.]|nr:nucleoside triphosphate pyrophosphohydrolase [Synergistes sp.]